MFFSFFFSFLGYPVLHNAFFPEIQHDGSVSNANFPIDSIKVAKDCLTLNQLVSKFVLIFLIVHTFEFVTPFKMSFAGLKS